MIIFYSYINRISYTLEIQSFFIVYIYILLAHVQPILFTNYNEFISYNIYIVYNLTTEQQQKYQYIYICILNAEEVSTTKNHTKKGGVY